MRQEKERCDACGIIEGGDLCNEVLSPRIKYGGKYNICQDCEQRWQELDEIVGRKTTWPEYLDPRKAGL